MDASPHSITPLRQRMIDDMRMRKLAEKTQSHYIRAVRQFAGFLGHSPDTATVEDLRRYQLHLVDHMPRFPPSRLVRRLPARRRHVAALLRVRAGIAQPLTSAAIRPPAGTACERTAL